MNLEAIKNAWLTDQLSQDEAVEAVWDILTGKETIRELLESWSHANALKDAIIDMQGATPPPRLNRAVVVDLVDIAFRTGHINWVTAVQYLSRDGMMTTVARQHMRKVQSIKDMDAEREACLADPDGSQRFCTRCGASVLASDLSQRGICTTCGIAAQSQCVAELEAKAGPYYRKWRKGMLDFADSLESAFAKEHLEQHSDIEGDRIDHDKLPGCDGECDSCEDVNCAYRRRSDAVTGSVPDQRHEVRWLCEGCGTTVRQRMYCECGNSAPGMPPKRKGKNVAWCEQDCLKCDDQNCELRTEPHTPLPL